MQMPLKFWHLQYFGFIPVSLFDVWVGLVVGTGLVAPLHSTKKAAEEKSERDVAEKSESDGREIRKRGRRRKERKGRKEMFNFFQNCFIFWQCLVQRKIW